MASKTISFIRTTLTRHPSSRFQPSHALSTRPLVFFIPFRQICASSTNPLPTTPTPIKKHSKKVSVLPLQVIQHIASGEVLPSPTSYLSELVENSLDASASSVLIHLNLKSNSITVTDNGSGISIPEGLLSVATCNATSKLSSLSELQAGVDTLGFRGQGLWAIATRARALTVASRIKEQLSGVSVSFGRDGQSVEDSVRPVPMAVGTVVNIDGIPWRIRGREVGKVVVECKAWLFRASLCHPEVSFRVMKDGKMWWGSVGDSKEGNRNRNRVLALAKEFGASVEDFRQGSVMVNGVGVMDVVVGIPSILHSGSRASVITAVNGRCVGLHALSTAITRVMTVRKGRYPVAFVHLTVPKENVDWNAAPMKSVVRFKTEEMMELIVNRVSSVISDILGGMPLSRATGVEYENLPFSAHEPKMLQKLMSLLPTNGKRQEEQGSGDGKPVESQRTVLATSLPRGGRIVAQLLQTYMLIEYSGGVILVEQHVAEERVLYEELLRTWSTGRFSELREPVRLPSSINEDSLFSLESLGFEVEHNSTAGGKADSSVYSIRSVPAVLKDVPPTLLGPLLIRLCSQASSIEEAAAAVSCRLATKNGTPLSSQKMSAIFSKLMKCENPYTCPHGRPIFLDLQTRDLAHLFGRSWLPERMDMVSVANPGMGQGVLPE